MIKTITIRRWDNGDVIFSYFCKYDKLNDLIIEQKKYLNI